MVTGHSSRVCMNLISLSLHQFMIRSSNLVHTQMLQYIFFPCTVLAAPKCRAATGKFIFFPFPKTPRSLSKIPNFLTKKYPQIWDNLGIFPVDCCPFLNGFFPTREPTTSMFMYVVAVLCSFLGSLCLCQYFYPFRVWPHI